MLRKLAETEPELKQQLVSTAETVDIVTMFDGDDLVGIVVFGGFNGNHYMSGGENGSNGKGITLKGVMVWPVRQIKELLGLAYVEATPDTLFNPKTCCAKYLILAGRSIEKPFFFFSAYLFALQVCLYIYNFLMLFCDSI
jgi:hypothetical protein